MTEATVETSSMEATLGLFGNFDENIKQIEKALDVSIFLRGNEIKITGEADNVSAATRAVTTLMQMISRGETISEQSVRYVLSLLEDGKEGELTQLSGSDCICITTKGKPVKPKTLGQKKYIEAISNNTIVFGIGPAGTGKTYLAVAMAVAAFREKRVSRIILTRPAVEAGEKLGFLPGDLQQKIDPYLRPLYDALFDMLLSLIHI